MDGAVKRFKTKRHSTQVSKFPAGPASKTTNSRSPSKHGRDGVENQEASKDELSLDDILKRHLQGLVDGLIDLSQYFHIVRELAELF